MRLVQLAPLGLGAIGLWLLLGGRRRVALPLLTVGDSIAQGIGEALERELGAWAATDAQSGESVSSTATRLAGRLADAPAARTVVLSTGVNSLRGEAGSAATVMSETVAIVAAIRATGRDVVLVGPPPAFGMPGATDAWRGELEALERLHGRMTGRVSLWQLLGDSSNEGYSDERYGTPGGLHPNRAGYERVARAILRR